MKFQPNFRCFMICYCIRVCVCVCVCEIHFSFSILNWIGIFNCSFIQRSDSPVFHIVSLRSNVVVFLSLCISCAHSFYDFLYAAWQLPSIASEAFIVRERPTRAMTETSDYYFYDSILLFYFQVPQIPVTSILMNCHFCLSMKSKRFICSFQFVESAMVQRNDTLHRTQCTAHSIYDFKWRKNFLYVESERINSMNYATVKKHLRI